jgi:hypothetical protein
MRSLVKRATAAAVSTMRREAESSHASDSGVGTKNSSRPGSRLRRLRRSRSATRIRRISLVDAPPTWPDARPSRPGAAPTAALPPPLTRAAGDSRRQIGPSYFPSRSGLHKFFFAKVGKGVVSLGPCENSARYSWSLWLLPSIFLI